MTRLPVFAFLIACMSIPANAHEFWIDPEDFTVAPGDEIVAALRVGEKYEGASYSYLPQNFRRFDYVLNGVTREVPGRMGDRPAVNMEVAEEGLVVLVHATTDYKITWDDWADFVAFVEHKSLDWVLEKHAERELPEEKVSEAYSRYAKSLIAVGDGAGDDSKQGLLTEIVALENPYTDEMSDGIDVLVLFQGEPSAEAQVEIFEKAEDGSVAVKTVVTNDEGEATIPVRPGHRYQLDSVVARVPSAELAAEKGVLWETLWANLTFAVPSE